MQPSASSKPPRPKKTKKQEPVFQPSLGNMMDLPLVEPDGTDKAPEMKNMPGLRDFSNARPAKKWDDPKRDSVAGSVREQNRRAFQPVVQMPLLWQQDAPLTEDDSPEAAKAADFDDAEFFSSVSPMKVMDPESAPDKGSAPQVLSPDKEKETSAPAVTDEYEPDSGSLLSDLMNEINSNSVTPAPQENKARENGTTFFTGTRPEKAEPEPVSLPVPETQIPPVQDILPGEEETLSSAAALDQILRGLGYQTENEIQSAAPGEPALIEPENKETPEEIPAGTEAQEGQEDIAADEIPADLSLTDEIETKIPDKEDPVGEAEIPWDLFGSQDMTLPQSPEDPSFRTFSKSSIPTDGESSTYQERMMSSILGKIIDAENFVMPRKKSGERSISPAARLFWSIVALGGIVLILLTGIADRINVPALPAAPGAEAFYQSIADAAGEVLVVLDYTPAYGAELDQALDLLITSLEKSAKGISICSLNPAAMPRVRQILQDHEKSVRFAGWWPAGVISIRFNLAAGNVPDQVWLVTSESGSVKNWAEQLAISKQKRNLHVMASGQLEPLLRPYTESGMITSALSRDRDLLHFADKNIASDGKHKAVLYLTALVPLAWLGGLFTKFLKSDPNYGMKKSKKSKDPRQDPEKEAVNAGRL